MRYALQIEPRRRQRYPHELARFRVARLRTQGEVDAFLRSAGAPSRAAGGAVSDTGFCQDGR